MAEQFDNAQKKTSSRDLWNTNERVDSNASLLKRMTQTMMQITSLNWEKYLIEKAQLKSKIAD